MSKPAIALGCDHAGYDFKEEIKKELQTSGYDVHDFGTHSSDSVDYPDFVHPAADYVEQNAGSLGILICGSANGVAITANKHQHIRAAIAWQEELASLARRHNNANMICLPARFISIEVAKKCVKTFISTDFEGGRHQSRIDKIAVC